MDVFELLVSLHKTQYRQGPGSDNHSGLALELSGLKGLKQLKIADIGCGSGASSIFLAQNLNANITAVDLLPEFLNILNKNAKDLNLCNKINTIACSMDSLPFEKSSLDAIWAEGSIYNIGFKKGVNYFKTFLKKGGILACSEITWLTEKRPTEINDYWVNNYKEIATSSEKIKILEEEGFKILGYFPLPQSCWLENYYNPLEARFDSFLKEYNFKEAKEIIEAEKKEIQMYKKYKEYYSYGFYIAQKIVD
jgi:ubiquinone/menaquinone biosynthesis C-methylase UbiE